MNPVTETLLANNILLTAIMAWFVAQAIKILLELLRSKKLKLGLLMSSGGMPSSHSSTTTSAAVAIGLYQGFDTPLFALSAVLAMVVMYDAAGVRRSAGRQAEVINRLLDSIDNIGIKLDKKLKEALGHSPVEVFAGGILGIVIAVIMN